MSKYKQIVFKIQKNCTYNMFYSCQLIMHFVYIVILLHTASSGREKLFIVKIEVKDENAHCAGIPVDEYSVFSSMKDMYSNCAGTIITRKVVLTAAHCVYKKKDISVVQFTTHKINRYEIDAVFVHPDFDCLNFCNDIALIKIKTHFRKPWEAAILNDYGLRSSLKVYENCKMVGWLLNDRNSILNSDKNKSNRLDNPKGSSLYEEEPVTLTRVPVKIITSNECSRKIKNFGGSFAGEDKLCGVNVEEFSNHWCSVGSGGPLLCPSTVNSSKNCVNCEKDSVEIANNLDYERIKYLGANGTLGDPLDLLANFYSKRSIDDDREYQIGVLSWGKLCSKVPSIFMRTDTYFKWIKQTIENSDNITDMLVTSTLVFGTTNKSVTAVESLLLMFSSLLLRIPWF